MKNNSIFRPEKFDLNKFFQNNKTLMNLHLNGIQLNQQYSTDLQIFGAVYLMGIS